MLNLDILNIYYGQIYYITSSYGFPTPDVRPLILTRFWDVPSEEAHFSKKIVL